MAGESSEERARSICLAQLAMAPRSRAQLESALARREIDPGIGASVLDRLAAVGLVDDAAFAAELVRTRARDRGLARPALRRELRATGVGAEDAATALAAVADDDELEIARRLVARRLSSTTVTDPVVLTRRLVGMLARKGHSASTSYRVVREALLERALDGAALEHAALGEAALDDGVPGAAHGG